MSHANLCKLHFFSLSLSLSLPPPPPLVLLTSFLVSHASIRSRVFHSCLSFCHLFLTQIYFIAGNRWCLFSLAMFPSCSHKRCFFISLSLSLSLCAPFSFYFARGTTIHSYVYAYAYVWPFCVCMLIFTCRGWYTKIQCWKNTKDTWMKKEIEHPKL